MYHLSRDKTRECSLSVPKTANYKDLRPTKKRVVGNNMGHDKIEIESSKNYGNDLVKINV